MQVEDEEQMFQLVMLLLDPDLGFLLNILDLYHAILVVLNLGRASRGRSSALKGNCFRQDWASIKEVHGEIHRLNPYGVELVVLNDELLGHVGLKRSVGEES
ncbi:hypothetical protein VNO80_13294 [Phaseolus coccineus]|uniref:Uncharacterized protein n=1 Tax=Phaseolus coccineus TaxID=3886 RepID=A0AAN9N1D3_PHACN